MATNKIILDTKGMCLLCLSNVTALGQSLQPTSTTTFKIFLRYLKIDILQLKQFEFSVLSSMHDLGANDDDCGIVCLCKTCVTKVDKIAEMYTIWENIGFKLELSVKDIHIQMLISKSDPVKLDEYQKRMKSDTHWTEVLRENVVADFRKETLDKCSGRINSSTLQNYPSTVISRDKSRLNPTSQPISDETTNNSVSSPQLTNQLTDDPQPSSNSGTNTLSRDFFPPETDQLQMEVTEGEVNVKVKYLSSLQCDDAEDDKESFSHSDDEMLEEDPIFNSTRNEEIAVSSSILCRSDIVNKLSDQVAEEHEGEVLHSEISILARPSRVKGKIDKNVLKSSLASLGPICNKRQRKSIRLSKQNWQPQIGQISQADQSLKCLTCFKVCKTNAELIVHVRAHREDQESVRTHTPDSRNGPFKCVFCDHVITHRNNKPTHMATRHTWKFLEEFLPPGVTEAQLNTAIGREMTKMITHPKELGAKYPVKCPHCPREFRMTSELRSHIIQRHHDKFNYA